MSDWDLILLRQAYRFLEKIPPPTRSKVFIILKQLTENPSLVSLKNLKGRPEKSIGLGEYRILVRLHTETKKIVVTRIGPRGDIYKK